MVGDGRAAFISYVSEDQVLVDRLCAALDDAGVTYWRDRNELAVGDRWKSRIRSAIEAGSHFVACFSANSERKDRSFMREELTLAIDEMRLRTRDRAWFLPVVLTPCELPRLDIGGGETLHDIQYLDLSEAWEEGIQQLVAALQEPYVATEHESAGQLPIDGSSVAERMKAALAREALPYSVITAKVNESGRNRGILVALATDPERLSEYSGSPNELNVLGPIRALGAALEPCEAAVRGLDALVIVFETAKGLAIDLSPGDLFAYGDGRLSDSEIMRRARFTGPALPSEERARSGQDGALKPPPSIEEVLSRTPGSGSEYGDARTWHVDIALNWHDEGGSTAYKLRWDPDGKEYRQVDSEDDALEGVRGLPFPEDFPLDKIRPLHDPGRSLKFSLDPPLGWIAAKLRHPGGDLKPSGSKPTRGGDFEFPLTGIDQPRVQAGPPSPVASPRSRSLLRALMLEELSAGELLKDRAHELGRGIILTGEPTTTEREVAIWEDRVEGLLLEDEPRKAVRFMRDAPEPSLHELATMSNPLRRRLEHRLSELERIIKDLPV